MDANTYNATIKMFGSEWTPAFESEEKLTKLWGRNWGCGGHGSRRLRRAKVQALELDERDVLTLAVFGDHEVVGGQTFDRIAVAILDADRLNDQPCGRAKDRLLLRLLSLLSASGHTLHQDQRADHNPSSRQGSDRRRSVSLPAPRRTDQMWSAHR